MGEYSSHSGLIIVELRKKKKTKKNGIFATAHFYVELFSTRLFGNSKSLVGLRTVKAG